MVMLLIYKTVVITVNSRITINWLIEKAIIHEAANRLAQIIATLMTR